MELCAEDNFGVWELYWRYQQLVGKGKTDDGFFISEIERLCADGTISAYDRNKYSKSFDAVALEPARLKAEVASVRNGEVEDSYYWFGLNNR